MEEALSHINSCLSEDMKESLRSPITLLELELALKDMQVGKAPGPDGVIVEFYTTFWDLIGNEFLDMINSSIVLGRHPLGVTRGLLALLHKSGDRPKLANWRPITLLNISYKLFTKVLQKCVQLVLMEIISPDQAGFLPM